MNRAALIVGVALALSASVASAQRPAERGVRARLLDTRKFARAIDLQANVKPERPVNPQELPEYGSEDNGLPIVRTRTRSRVVAGGLFPAIGSTGWTPPDPDIAVGPNQIVATVNAQVAFFDKASGTKTFQQSAGAFFAGLGAGTFLFDPKCLFDRVHQRFVVVFLEGETNLNAESKVLLAVSDDADPAGVWYRYRLEGKIVSHPLSWEQFWIDYPGLTYSNDAYVVCGNMFGFSTGTFGGTQFVVIPSAPVLAGAPATSFSLLDTERASYQMVEPQDAPGPFVYGVARNGTSAIEVAAIADAATAPTLAKTSVTVPSFSTPSSDAVSTNGRLLATLDGRLLNAASRAGGIVTAHTVQNGALAASRWYQIQTGAWPAPGAALPSLAQSGQIDTATLNCFMPAINVNSIGDISILYTQSSSTLTASIAASGRQFGDVPGAMSVPYVLENSVGASYPNRRWGDYFGVDVDPNDDTTFWGIGMTVASTNNWTTAIHKWKVSPELNALTVAPASVRGSISAIATVRLNWPAPSGGTTVTLQSSNPSIARVPASVTVPMGQTSATFSVATSRTARDQSVTLTATYGGASKTATLLVTKR